MGAPASRSAPPSRLPRLTAVETLRFARDVGGPLVARGLIVRRPKVVRFLEALDADRRAVDLLVRLHRRHGDGPLRVPIPGRSLAVVVSPDQVHEILDASPEPFHPATSEKRAALDHFQPGGVLATRGSERAPRRRLNEEALEHDRPRHDLAQRFDRVVDEEAGQIADRAVAAGALDWETFTAGWQRVVRRCVLGDRARDDVELTELIDGLRRSANWAFARPIRRRARRRFDQMIEGYLRRPEPGSLAEVLAQRTRDDSVERPSQQVPQWLFAFDPAGMATHRTMALLAAHPDQRDAALAEADEDAERPRLRAAVLESLRLWPTTPGILREATVERRWAAGSVPPGTSLMIFTPLFHRHPSLAGADTFGPERWLEHRDERSWPLVPFSGGPAMCPGRNVVLTTTTSMVAALHRRLDLAPEDPSRLDPKRLPSVLDPYTIRFAARAASPASPTTVPARGPSADRRTS